MPIRPEFLHRPIALEFTLTGETHFASLTNIQRSFLSSDGEAEIRAPKVPRRFRVTFLPDQPPAVQILRSTPFGANWECLDHHDLVAEFKIPDLLARVLVQQMVGPPATGRYTAEDMHDALILNFGEV